MDQHRWSQVPVEAVVAAAMVLRELVRGQVVASVMVVSLVPLALEAHRSQASLVVLVAVATVLNQVAAVVMLVASVKPHLTAETAVFGTSKQVAHSLVALARSHHHPCHHLVCRPSSPPTWNVATGLEVPRKVASAVAGVLHWFAPGALNVPQEAPPFFGEGPHAVSPWTTDPVLQA
jgi:hypothetical protein